MSCDVPDYAPEDDTAVFTRKIAEPAGEEFVKLLRQKGPFFSRRSPDLRPAYASSGVSSHSTAAAAATSMASSTELFMEEDEMASWLYYPVGGDDDPGGVGNVGGVDSPQQPREAAAPAAGSEHSLPVAAAGLKVEEAGWAASGRPPPHPAETRGRLAALATAFLHRLASAKSTVVESRATTTEPVMMMTRRGTESRVSSGDVRGEAPPCEPGPPSSARGDERKRKGRQEDDYDSHSEDGELEASGKRRELRRSSSARRARAAEVHNLSERRRRDRINEKMKALQQLIPRCHKTDKASMLDDAIEYMKSLQMQVQMMSMCCNMAPNPMMFPAGVQQYMPSAGMGIPMGMGMGMGMEMAPSGGLCRPMVPFPTVVPGAQVGANGAAHPSQALPLQHLHGPVGALAADQMRLHGTGQADIASSSSASFRASGAVQMPNLAGLPHQAVHPQSH